MPASRPCSWWWDTACWFRSASRFSGVSVVTAQSLRKGLVSGRPRAGSRRSGANSSAGSERLPYTQDVGGSNPSSPTRLRARAVVAGPSGQFLCGGQGMFLFRLVILAVAGTSVLSPLAAQGIPRGSRASSATVNTAPRFMVANPFAFAGADSAPAVKIGSAMREEIKDVVGRDYQVIEQAQMNDALKQYGYPVDAILSPALATTLAKNIQARFVVNSTLNKGEGGRYTVSARLIGVSDDAGNVVTLAQNAGETPEAFGKRLGAALQPLVKSLADAKACIEQRASKADKAADAASKALKTVPNHGLAEYCLALLAQDK